MISQCPNCKTRFVVGETKLNIAGGSVRCGACMQVFSATDHQMTDHRQTSADTPKVEKPTTISNKDITEEPLNNSLPASDDSDHTTNLPDKNALKKTGEGIPQNDERIEPSIESMTSFEVPPTIVAPPIEMDISEKPPLKNRLFGLIGVSFCLVLIFVLALHWLLAHPEQFKDHPRWRTTYQLACQLTHSLINCDPTDSKNTDQTQLLRVISKRVISHPEQENSLLLETVILNSSKRPLAFPIINVQFSNIKEQSLAEFNFTAVDYLHGELKDAQYIPPATPVHISLKIIDPGPTAVNFTVELK